MALRTYDLRIGIYANNLTGNALRRVAADLRALGTAADIEGRKAAIAARETSLLAKAAQQTARIQALAPGGALYVAREQKLQSAIQRRVGIENQLKAKTAQRAEATRRLARIETQQAITQAQIATRRSKITELAPGGKLYKDRELALTNLMQRRERLSRSLHDLEVNRGQVRDRLRQNDILQDKNAIRLENARRAAAKGIPGAGERLKIEQKTQQQLRGAQETLIKSSHKLGRQYVSLGGQVTTAQRAVDNFTSTDKYAADEIAKHRQKISQLTNTTQGLSDSRLALNNATRKMGRDTTQLKSKLQSAITAEQQLGNTSTWAAKQQAEETAALERTNAAVAEQRRQMAMLNTQIRQMKWDRVSRAANVLTGVSRTARLAGLFVGAAVGFAAYQFGKLDQQATITATQMGRVGRTFQDVRRDAKNMRDATITVMRDSTSSMDDLTATSYDLFSSLSSTGKEFLTLRDGVKILKLLSNAAIASGQNIKTISTGVISVMNSFGITADQMPRTMNRLFAAVRFGRMTFGEFAGVLGQTASASKATNQTLDTMAGTMSFLTRRLPVRMAAVGYARLMETLSKPKFIENMRKLGVEITDARGRMLQLPEIMDRILTRFPALKQGGVLLTNFFKLVGGATSTMQARRAWTFLATQPEQYRKLLLATTRDNNEFTKSQIAANQSLGVQWQKFLNRLHADILILGRDAIPAITALAGPLGKIVKWFEDLDPKVRKQIMTWAVWAAGIGLVGGTLGALAGGLLHLVAIFGAWGRITGLNIAILVALVAVVVRGKGAMKAFSEMTHLAGQALSKFFDFAGSGWKQFGVAAIAGTLVARKAIMGLLPLIAAVSAGVGGVRARAATGGIGALATAASSGIILPVGVSRNAEQAATAAGRFRTSLAAAGATAMALPGWLKVSAAVIGVAGVAAYFWHKHMDAVKRRAQEIRDATKETIKYVDILGVRLQHIGQVPQALIDLQANRAALAGINAQIKGMPAGPERNSLLAQRATLMRDIAKSQTIITRGQIDFSKGVTGQDKLRVLYQNLSRAQERLANAQDRLRKLQTPASINKLTQGQYARQVYEAEQAIKAAQKDVDKLNARIDTVRTKAGGPSKRLQTLRKELGDAITVMQNMQMLPNLPKEMRNKLITAMIDAQRILSAAELRVKIRAQVEIDIASLKAAIAGIQTMLNVMQPVQDVLSIFGVKLPGIDAMTKQQAALTKELNKQKAIIKSLNAIENPTKKQKKALDDATATYNEILRLLGEQGDGSTKAADKADQAAQKIIDAYEKQKQAVQTYTQTLQQAYNQMEQTNKAAMGDFITGSQYFMQGIGSIKMNIQQTLMGLTPDWKTILNPQDILTAAKQQVDAFERWRKDIDTVTKGMPADMAQTFRDMGAQGAPILEAIMQMSPAQRRKLIALWKKGQGDIQAASKRDFNSTLRYWRSLGKNIFAAIMEGMAPDEAKMNKWMRAMAITFLKIAGKYDPGLAAAAAKAQAELDKPDKPTGTKAKPKTKPKPKGAPSGSGGGGKGTRSTQSAGVTVHQNIYATHNESLDQTLRKANFRFRNGAGYLPAT